MIPVLVVAGWLGSGKTTLLNRLLEAATGERLAVVVNDVGEVNIDAALIARRAHDTVELTNGCICCSIGGSLALTLRDLVCSSAPPDRILIEASGVADPGRIAAYGDRRRLALEGIVVTVDVLEVESRAADPTYGRLVVRQVEAADLLVLTKTDIAGTAQRERAETWCRSHAGATPMVTAPRSLPDTLALLTGGGSGSATDEPPVAIASATWRPPGPVEPERVAEALAGADVLRAKGVLSAPNGDRYVVQCVGRRVEATPLTGTDLDLADALVLIARDRQTLRSVALPALEATR